MPAFGFWHYIEHETMHDLDLEVVSATSLPV